MDKYSFLNALTELNSALMPTETGSLSCPVFPCKLLLEDLLVIKDFMWPL